MRLREINSPGELTVDPDLIERFTSRGWQIMGEGRDQIVLMKPGTNTVLKIVGSGSLPRQAEIRRYVNFFRANQRNPHFPRVGPDRELDWKGRKYYAYTQERLWNLPGDEAVMDYLEHAMGELGHGQEPDLARVPSGLTVEQVEGLIMTVDHMFESGLGGQYGFDLSNLANIMQRQDGQLVIVDPFSGFDDELGEALMVSVEPAQQAVAEARQPVLNILRQALPDWPDYVLKDWLGTRVKDQEDLKNLRGWIDEIKKTVQPNSWRLHQKMPITFDMLDPKTRYFMKTKRQFGDRNPFMIPRDRERLEDAMRLIQEKGIENLPPVIMLQGPQGLELTEGWHRTMAAFRQHPDGFRINAWIGQRSQQVNEVQILAKVKGKGSEPGQIPKYGRPISADQEVRYLGQQVGDMGRYQLWRDWLGGQLSFHVFDPESRTVVLTTFGSRYHRNPNSYIIHGLYAAPGNPVKAHQFYRNLILDQGLTLISDRKQSPGGNRVWQRLEAYPDIEVYGFDTKTGEVMNFGAADAEMYAVPPRAAQDRESKYIAKNIRLVATAR